MYIFIITFAVIPCVAHTVSCESTKESPQDIQAKTTLKTPINEALTSAMPSNTNPKGSLWANNQISHQPQEDNIVRYKMLLKAPYSLTKLAKTLSQGFDPSFNKDYFEPFERRPRPVTLVAFRKKGFASRHIVKLTESRDVAELQSPYNEISNFWQNEKEA